MDTCFGTWVSFPNTVQFAYVTAVTQFTKVHTRQCTSELSPALCLHVLALFCHLLFAPGCAMVVKT